MQTLLFPLFIIIKHNMCVIILLHIYILWTEIFAMNMFNLALGRLLAVAYDLSLP